MAHELPAPPPGWREKVDPPTHAVEINSRNQVILRPIGDDIEVKFKSGNSSAPVELRSGGLSLPGDLSGDDPDPKAPPSRCGSSIGIVFDTSGSVPQSGGGEQAKAPRRPRSSTPSRGHVAARLVRVRQPGVSQSPGYRFGPVCLAVRTIRAPTSAAARKRFMDLDNRDNNWNQSLPDSPTVDGIHWDQTGTGTNWEDALYLPFHTDAGALRNDTPELVVLITDGRAQQEPSRVVHQPRGQRHGDGRQGTWDGCPHRRGHRRQRGPSRQLEQLRPSDDDGEEWWSEEPRRRRRRARLGRLGDEDPTTGKIDVVPGNAKAADLFYTTNFDTLGGVLRSIMIAECGGTVTIQKKLSVDGTLTNLTDVPSNTVWKYKRGGNS